MVAELAARCLNGVLIIQEQTNNNLTSRLDVDVDIVYYTSIENQMLM
jgi:hypothetical protein